MTREEILQIAKPILFNTEMVRAILENRKSVTRRIANISTDISCTSEDDFTHEFIRDDYNSAGSKYTGFVCRKCGFGVCPPHSKYPCGTSWIRPRYNVGDYLYIRETWMIQAAKRYDALVRIGYRAGGQNTTIHFPYGGTDSINRYDYDSFVMKRSLDRWYPSIHMPKEAARIFLRVTDVRVERLQAMTLDDFLSEGVVLRPEDFNDPENAYRQAQKIFIGIWNPTTDELIYKWDANPWVWVIKFERVEV